MIYRVENTSNEPLYFDMEGEPTPPGGTLVLAGGLREPLHLRNYAKAEKAKLTRVDVAEEPHLLTNIPLTGSEFSALYADQQKDVLMILGIRDEESLRNGTNRENAYDAYLESIEENE